MGGADKEGTVVVELMEGLQEQVAGMDGDGVEIAGDTFASVGEVNGALEPLYEADVREYGKQYLHSLALVFLPTLQRAEEGVRGWATKGNGGLRPALKECDKEGFGVVVDKRLGKRPEGLGIELRHDLLAQDIACRTKLGMAERGEVGRDIKPLPSVYKGA